MKKKKRMKKEIKIILYLIIAITISYISITIIKKLDNQEMIIPLPSKKNDNKEIEKEDETTIKLKELNYTVEGINTIKQYVSEENIEYLINNKINHEIAESIVNETYYIDDYLKKYINYYNENNNKTYSEIITIINTHIDNEFYTNTMKTDTSLGKFVILNKYYYADASYPSEKLISVPGKYHVNGTSVKLTQECFDAFLKMYNDAYEAGYGFKLKSAYRSYDTQITTYNYWVSKENGNKAKADTYSARAGYSEHQTGYAFDIRDYNYEYEDYEKSKSFQWVSQNAHKYGFIIRFPKNKEYITGYQYESWHYRYCGIECATYIYENNITFEEYYEYFIKYNNPKNLS